MANTDRLFNHEQGERLIAAIESSGCCEYTAGDGIIINNRVISAEVTQQKLDDAIDNILDGTITGISVTREPTKTTYASGETLNLTGMVVAAVYANGRTQPITGYTTSPANGEVLADSQTAVTISWTYNGTTYTTTQPISVGRVLDSISVTQPSKAAYTQGETLNLAGAIVTAYYTSGSSLNVTNQATFAPANGTLLTIVGTQVITASYSEGGVTRTATTSVTVQSATTVFQYSAILDLNKSDPNNIVEYADDATGQAKGWNNWKNKDIFKDIRPCVLQNGAVLYYLDPDNYAKKTDGTNADITTFGNDVMIEIPYRIGYSIEWVDSAQTKLKVSITNEPNASGFCYDAFSLDANNDCDRIYIGAYKASINGNMLYSSSGKAPYANATIGAFRTAARARGTGYQQRTYGSLKLMQCLYIIAHGDLNSQAVVGRGFVDGNSAAAYTGGANALGFDFELASSAQKTNGKTQVKCLGLEDFWGNVWEWIDGLASDAQRNVLTETYAAQFNDAGANYVNNGNGGVTSDAGGWMSLPQGGSNKGFVYRQANGSENAFFADGATLYASRVAYFGGVWYYASGAGAFALHVDNAASYAYSTIGGRLVYMHKQ